MPGTLEVLFGFNFCFFFKLQRAVQIQDDDNNNDDGYK